MAHFADFTPLPVKSKPDKARPVLSVTRSPSSTDDEGPPLVSDFRFIEESDETLVGHAGRTSGPAPQRKRPSPPSNGARSVTVGPPAKKARTAVPSARPVDTSPPPGSDATVQPVAPSRRPKPKSVPEVVIDIPSTRVDADRKPVIKSRDAAGAKGGSGAALGSSVKPISIKSTADEGGTFVTTGGRVRIALSLFLPFRSLTFWLVLGYPPLASMF